MCFTTLGALPKHFFGFDIPSRSGQPQLSNLTNQATSLKVVTAVSTICAMVGAGNGFGIIVNQIL